MQLTSPAFAHRAAIPARHTCDGEDLSPPLTWSAPPPGTVAFALVCDDPDAPGGAWDHWVLYDIPGAARGLSEGVPANATLPDGARHGVNGWRRMGWGGPCPPPGKPHHYLLRLYALSAATGLPPRATKAELMSAVAGKVLATAELTGVYGRAAGR